MEALWEILQDTVKEAVTAFNASRQKEGTQLLADLEEKLAHMLEMVQVIEERSPVIIQIYREELEKKVADMLEGSGIELVSICPEDELDRSVQSARRAVFPEWGLDPFLD